VAERQKDQSQLKKNQGKGKLGSFVIFIAIFIIIVIGAKFVGRQAGKQAAIRDVERESIAQNAPTGFMGAKWLMSTNQVKSLFPDATEFAPGTLRLETTAFGRPAAIHFICTKDMLIMIIINFKGEKSERTYRQTHDLVEKEYGAFPEPSSTSEFVLRSNKKIGRIAIEHLLYQELGMPIEQVILYRTKSN